MSLLHNYCCNPNVDFNTIELLVRPVPEARFYRDIQGKIPFQRFLLSRDLPDSDGEDENEEDPITNMSHLPSLALLLRNGMEAKDFKIACILNERLEKEEQLTSVDSVTKLTPFMSAATYDCCKLDIVYTLAMKTLPYAAFSNNAN